MLSDSTLNSIRSEIFVRMSQQNPLALQDMANNLGVFRKTAAAVLSDRLFSEDRKTVEEALSAVLRDPYGWGPVFELVCSKTVNNIWINNYLEIMYEDDGQRRRWPHAFESEEQLRRLAERLALASGRRADESNPLVDCRLFDGSRVSIALPPVSTRGTSITVRKFPRIFTLEDLAQRKLFPAMLVPLFKLFVKARLNIMIAGGMGSGKNTFLNALLLCVGRDENLIFVEDPAESRVGLPDPERPDLPRPFVKVYEPRPANLEGKGEIGLDVIFEKTLRQQPDRVIVSECRSRVTAHYTLQAMNIAHPGSMSTIHAEEPEEVPGRLGELLGGSAENLRRVAALEIILFLAQLKAGDGMPSHRRLMDICEVKKRADGLPEVVPLYSFNFQGYDDDGTPLGELKFMGNVPAFLKKRKAAFWLTSGERGTLGKFFGVG